ncbi:hypothetical protein [Shimia aestuarii]|uniref:hypothetical protein n=1 Tax=Shimia aestuarii TaxID=254406 RepID=UPI001FB5263C|nr:hypothetical protein [Shimia aestuarii]
MALVMNLDPSKVELLMRLALLDDAANVNERMGALTAEIYVLDDEEVDICLDVNLWPESKGSPSVEALAKMLWLNVEWTASDSNPLFAWPEIGSLTQKAPEYFKMVLDAHRSQKPKN